MLICAIATCGCSRGSPSTVDSRATLNNGLTTVPHVQEIQGLFPNARINNFISEYGYGYDARKMVVWNTEVFFGGRYILTYQINVTADYKGQRISRIIGNPRFVLVEVNRIFNASPESLGADIAGDYKFNDAQWEKVVANKGDFRVIGIMVLSNAPLPKFNEFARSVGQGRIQLENGK